MREIETKLQAALVAAMKEKNEYAISAIRSIKTAIQNEENNINDSCPNFKLGEDYNRLIEAIDI